MRPPARFLLLTALLLASPAALAAGVTPSEATPVQREEAQTHFGRGRDLFAAKKFDDAAAEFERSYAIVASPNALLFLARCDRERGKLVRAYAELGRTAAEAREHAAEDTRYAKTAEAASEERQSLAPQLGFVTVTVHGGSPDAVVSVAGERFPRAALGEPLPVMPGSVVVAVESPGRAAVSQTATIAAGEKKSLAIDAGPVDVAPPPPPAPVASPAPVESSGPGPLRPWAFGAAGLGVAGLATFAIAGVVSNGTYSDLQSKCHATACPPGQGYDAEISRGKMQQTIANVGLVVGLVGVGAAVTLFVVSLPTRSSSVDRAARRADAPSDRVTAVVKPTWVGVEGTF